MAFVQRKSIHGREIGISTTGGIISTPRGSTVGHNSAAQMWGPGVFETLSAAAASISNSGVTVISSDSTSGAAFVMKAPVQGVSKEIHFQTPSTAHTINTTAITIFFNSSLAEGSTFGSTTLSIVGTVAGIGGVLVLRGLSATVWGITSNSVGASS